ncbi:MAG: hypothetical protein WBA13_08195 [Microcoleaceae cyanobacterium]
MIATIFLIHFSSLLGVIIGSLVFNSVLPLPETRSLRESEALSQCHNLPVSTTVSTASSAYGDQGCIAVADSLVNPLVQALPSYTNRVLQRSPEVGLGEKSNYVISAQGLTQAPFSLETELVQQKDLSSLYIMTRERRYRNQTVFNVERYHWLFLRHTPKGWEVVKLFSQSGPYPGYKLFPDPSDTTKGAMAEAIRLWLRDCQA